MTAFINFDIIYFVDKIFFASSSKRDGIVEKRVRLSMLLDIYGELLTKKQKDIMELYYNEDLSLKEIAEHTNTSRQAVYDIIKRCHKLLMQYENKLHVLKKKKSILKFIDSLCCSENKETLDKIKNYIVDNV